MARVIVAALLLAGCAQQQAHWVKEGTTPTEFQKDKAACVMEAKKATPDDGLSIGARYVEIETLCMQAKGYRS